MAINPEVKNGIVGSLKNSCCGYKADREKSSDKAFNRTLKFYELHCRDGYLDHAKVVLMPD
ncbi:MAG: hypothetical protein RIQ81_1121 [Pseudomonadota bacterium]